MIVASRSGVEINYRLEDRRTHFCVAQFFDFYWLRQRQTGSTELSFTIMKSTFILFSVIFSTLSIAAEPVHFARDVLPLLSTNCFACHGPDEHERKADLRLDQEEEAKALRDGGAAVTAGDIEKSSVVARIISSDPDLVMPPPIARRQLTAEQIGIIKRWIAEGAVWQRHWSFEPVVKPPGTLDYQVNTELAKAGLGMQATSSPHVLARRLSLDLIGLPPTPEVADEFAQNPSPAAYERLVDDLLQRSQFGEHWARMWLDLARYADTKGYEKDLGRSMWPYRDWVVNALNNDMPLDQFTLEQLAGDLLPNPTEQQIIATAFHRNTMSNDEGGTDDEEFRSIAVKDRIDTTVQVWMGLTMGCAKCHTHKYDPISQEAYYRFFAIFNQTEDADKYDDAPRLKIISDKQLAERNALSERVKAADAKLKSAEAELAVREDALWELPLIDSTSTQSGSVLTIQEDGSLLASGTSENNDTYVLNLVLGRGNYRSFRIEAMLAPLPDGQSGVGRNPKDPNFVLSELTVEQLQGDSVTALKLVEPRADFSQDGWPVASAIDGDLTTGWAVSPRQRERHVAIFDFSEGLVVEDESRLRITITQNYGDRLVLSKFRLSTSHSDPATLTPNPQSPATQQCREERDQAEKDLKSFEESLAMLPIMRELPLQSQRMTKVHKRGNFLDLGDMVTPEVLEDFGDLPAEVPRNRLGVAVWLVNKDNPLTPRVWANRIWARVWGLGIVETEEDFGALGAPPSNARLLDWLAAEYRDGGWSLKKLLKTIVMSQAYRQRSDVDPALRTADPLNRLASRGARFRLSAEVVRDQALAVAGLLSLKQGGPPVMPPQPAGLWRSTYNGQNWIDAEGEDRFRRGLYTYLKRTTPYPSFTTFDGGSGEVCQVRRINTNTPLQALVTLNDPVYLEAAASLARRMTEDASEDASRAERGLRLSLIRPLRNQEVLPLIRLQKEAQAVFDASSDRTEAIIKASRANPGGMKPSEFAAWIVVANAILNLDEFLTRN